MLEYLTDMPIHSLSGLKQAYNYIRFRPFYTSIYNICLGFIKIERKISRAMQKQSLPRRRISRGEVVRLGEASLRLGGADRGQNMVSSSPRQTYLRLGEQPFS